MSAIRIPHGDDLVTVELTVKEAMALGAGVRFRHDPQLSSRARRKVMARLDEKLLDKASPKLDYAELQM